MFYLLLMKADYSPDNDREERKKLLIEIAMYEKNLCEKSFVYFIS